MTVFWIAWIFIMVAITYFRLRLELVARYRHRLLVYIFAAGCDDIEHDRCPLWRYDVLDSVSFGKMLYQFWRPLESFYPDTRFTEKGESSAGYDLAELNKMVGK